jgi:hypothetical protein
MSRPEPRSGSVMRLHNRWLATPVLFYKNQGTGRDLVLILNSHIGTAEYFGTMWLRITQLEDLGWAVLWEGIGPAPAAEWATATPAERQAHQVMMRMFRDRYDDLAAYLGWVTQQDGLPPGDRWVNTDLNHLQVVREIGPDAILAMDADASRVMAKFGRHRGEWEQAIQPVVFRALARPHDALSRAIAQTAPRVYDILVDHRSKLAVDAVPPGRDTVMVWGTEHADTIHAALTQAGWVLRPRRRWLTVGRLPSMTRTRAELARITCAVIIDLWPSIRAAVEADTEGGSIMEQVRRGRARLDDGDTPVVR